MNNNEDKNWAEMYRSWAKIGNDHHWPSETLVRMMKGNFIPNLDKDYRGKKVLDVGCGNGNNLIFLSTLGLELYGTEIQQSICDDTMKNLKNVNFECDVKVGNNRNLPYPDDYFEYLVINVRILLVDILCLSQTLIIIRLIVKHSR